MTLVWLQADLVAFNRDSLNISLNISLVVSGNNCILPSIQ